MGLRYFCDYCHKSMVDSPTVIKTHNAGISHQKAVHDHYQKFKDPETIYEEESIKKPCTRFISGQCQFGSICRFSHYTAEELNALKNEVESRNPSNSEMVYPSFEDLFQNLLDEKSKLSGESDGNTMIYDDNGITHVLPWTYNPKLDTFGNNLPPSIRRWKVQDFNNADIVSWG